MLEQPVDVGGASRIGVVRSAAIAVRNSLTSLHTSDVARFQPLA